MNDAIKPYLKCILGIVVFALCGFLAYEYMTDLFLPFIIAMVLVYCLEPFVGLLENKFKIKRQYGSGIAVLLLLIIIGSILFFLGFKIFEEAIALYSSWFSRCPDLTKEVNNLESYIDTAYDYLPKSAINTINTHISKAYVVVEKILGGVVNLITSVPELITIFILSAIATYFISRDKKEIEAFVVEMIPSDWQEKTKNAYREVLISIFSFVKAQIILIFITMVMAIIGLTVIGQKYSLLLGTITGILDLLPVLGTAALYIPWIIYLLIIHDYASLVPLLIVYGILVIVRQIVEPKIIGNAIGVHPLASLMAMYIGAKLLGTSGVVIGPLALIIFNACLKSGLLTSFRQINRDKETSDDDSEYVEEIETDQVD